VASPIANHDAPKDGTSNSLDAASGAVQPLSSLEESLKLAEAAELEADLDPGDSVEFEDTMGPAEVPAEPEDGDESVADYIVDLLQRISGDSSDPVPANRYAPDVAQNVPDSIPSPSGANTDNEATLEAKPAEQKRREPAVLPESLRDMSAMRDLANQSARGAIDRHDQRQLTKSTYALLFLASLLIVLTLILGQITWVPLALRLSGTLVGLVASLYLCTRR
jgi:hypothetical protein